MNYGERISFLEFFALIETMLGNGYGSELEEFFNMIDIKNTKRISADDLILMMDKLGEKISKEEADNMILDADIDKDGFVNFDGIKSSFILGQLSFLLKQMLFSYV